MGNAATAGGSSMVTLIVYIVAMLAIFYFLLIRPQKKKEKEARLMMEALRVGDKIVTIGGIVGIVVKTGNDNIVIETGGDKHKIRIKKWAISENVTVKEKMEAAKSAVSEAIEKIKSFFDFEWHLPELKLPHIKINGEWDLKEGKFPSFDVEWYADGAVLNKPTIFGMNGNRPMIGGEAGAEAIAPIDVLQEYVSEAVASQNAGLIEILEKILIAILSLNDDMKDSFIEAVAGMKLNVNNREFARIVKAVY